MSFQDVNIDNWILDSSPNSSSTGKCSAWIDDPDMKQLTGAQQAESTNPGGNKYFDYYVCGENSVCNGLSHAEWVQIWDNCKSTPIGDYKWNQNYDRCYNSVTDDENIPKSFKAGCNSDIFYPAYGQWNGTSRTSGNKGGVDCEGATCYADEDCLDWWLDGNAGRMSFTTDTENLGGHAYLPATTPAYPTNIQQSESPIFKLFQSSKISTEKYDVSPCPIPGSRGFVCAGDGNSESDDVPGCGSGYEIEDHGLEDELKFCSRPISNYETINLMDCCLNEKGDDDQTSRKECPVGYCRTKVEYTDALENNRCIEPTGSVEYNQHCYEMTSECNNLFKEQCTAELFNNNSSDHSNKRIACRKWAKIQPADFEVFASSICSIQKNVMREQYTGQETSEEIITKLRSSNNSMTDLVNIFQSDLCRDWLVSNGQMKLLLSDICSVGVVKDEDGRIKVNRDNVPIGNIISNELSNICHCYWTEEYYTWYKENVLSEIERNSIGQNIRPECFHSKCMMSGIYTTEDNTECPSIINCRNEINTNILSVGNRQLTIDEEAIARLSRSQSCNIGIVNQRTATPTPTTPTPTTPTPTTPTPTTDTSGSSSTGGVTGDTTTTTTDSSTGVGDQGGEATIDGETRSYDGSGGRNTGSESGTSSKEPEDNNTVWIIVGVFVAILLIMIIVGASGGKSQKQWPIPGAYNHYMR
jgi:hypothetical protein